MVDLLVLVHARRYTGFVFSSFSWIIQVSVASSPGVFVECCRSGETSITWPTARLDVLVSTHQQGPCAGTPPPTSSMSDGLLPQHP